MQAYVTSRVTLREHGGRFLDRYQAAKRAAIAQTVKEGTDMAKAIAPKRTGRTAGSITPTVGSSGGTWAVYTLAGLMQEDGTRPHYMSGMVRFWWAKEGRWWEPGFNPIHHPGNPPVHFMRRSYEYASRRMVDHLREAM